ncbi:hypothetical protein LINPERHAP1_LOCUS39413, partial [Linum perenne]
SPDYNSNAEGIRFSSWALPGSLAVTKGILLTVASLADDFHFGHPVGYLEPLGGQNPHLPNFGGRATLCDTQADVPSTKWLQAQLAFKNSMVHGILQFTPSIAFCYVLHRCESRDIRCRESLFYLKVGGSLHLAHRDRAHDGSSLVVFLGAFRAGVC